MTGAEKQKNEKPPIGSPRQTFDFVYFSSLRLCLHTAINTTIAARGAVWEQNRTQLGTLGFVAIAIIFYKSDSRHPFLNYYLEVGVNSKVVDKPMERLSMCFRSQRSRKTPKTPIKKPAPKRNMNEQQKKRVKKIVPYRFCLSQRQNLSPTPPNFVFILFIHNANTILSLGDRFGGN